MSQHFWIKSYNGRPFSGSGGINISDTGDVHASFGGNDITSRITRRVREMRYGGTVITDRPVGEMGFGCTVITEMSPVPKICELESAFCSVEALKPIPGGYVAVDSSGEVIFELGS